MDLSLERVYRLINVRPFLSSFVSVFTGCAAGYLLSGDGKIHYISHNPLTLIDIKNVGEILIRNLLFVIVLVILSIINSRLPLIILFLNAAVVGILLQRLGIQQFIYVVLPHGIPEMTAIVIISGTLIKYHIASFREKMKKLIWPLALYFTSVFFEVYITPWLVSIFL
ncbi:stage II sporulation protein M [Lacticaseibacillus paracasei]|uniref:Stage II sporulation protein M n=1 Tax=Lacticaseibacillus paracasei subsp. paracasei Lpp41 TaxID=1256208 RepID=A0A829HCH2_LACPA|nr:stage II sporulation protein M [Lacticaseibacillus paracasei]EEI68164.1 membrane protein [Lacticaseibacillus paracasei subsp. paracasei ATCC 25302 = DSM 5622 = JCM 8130]EPC76242.1 hypothetical protein Lpp41_00520 [Lacticaseibacillus paracasei subsp. paracasei Lpp41]BAN73151.1 hypothetical protein LBPC_P1-0007 [Lacticaseibacillus paracasei subsp. paracasei]ATH00533.1 hypothetical protein FAM18149p_14235 [Lacticaseibacillus paracasei]MBU6045546.1 stage II sporulation protein M [Lacticaseibaci